MTKDHVTEVRTEGSLMPKRKKEKERKDYPRGRGCKKLAGLYLVPYTISLKSF
jgi:hypothetical protein